MIEFTVAGQEYRSALMPLRVQFHVTRRLAPVLGSIGPLLKGLDFSKLKDPEARVALFERVLEDVLPGIARTISEMSDADSDYIINACLRAAERKQAAGPGYARVMVGEALMFSDITLPSMMQITYQIMQDVLGPFFGATLSASVQPEGLASST